MLRLIFLLISLITVGCTTFPTSYARIEDDKVRLLDFIYEPAEASPGDTVKLRAVFSGKKVSATDIEWQISTNVFKNVYGVDTAFDIKPLTVPLYQDSFSENTSCVSFAFVIPHDIFTKSSMIPDDWTTIIPKEFRKSIPEDVAGLSKAQLLSVVEIASSMVDAAEENPLDSTYDQYKEMIPGILQALVVPVRFFARVKGSHRIQSDYSVSFNRRFGKLPGIYPNKNPVIDSLGIYKVNGENLALYNPASKKHTFYRLDIASDSVPVIRVERGYSYFVAAFTSGRDTAVTLDNILYKTPLKMEKLLTQWYFQLDENEIEGVEPGKYMSIAGVGDTIETFLPGADNRVKSFIIWLEVYDQMLNVLNRSQGSTLKEVRGQFEYTDEYIKWAEKMRF